MDDDVRERRVEMNVAGESTRAAMDASGGRDGGSFGMRAAAASETSSAGTRRPPRRRSIPRDRRRHCFEWSA